MKRITKEKIEFLKFINSDDGLRHFSNSFFNELLQTDVGQLVCLNDGSEIEIQRVLMLDHIDEAAMVIGILKAEGERFKIQMSYPIPHDVNTQALLFAVEDMSPELNEHLSPRSFSGR